jgi:chromosome segregation ATPase
MSDDSLRTQVDELKAELASAREAAHSAKKEILAKQEEEVKIQVEAFEATISEKDEAATSLEARIVEITEKHETLETELVQKQEELTEALDKIEAHEAEIKLIARKTALVEAGIEDVDEIIEKFASADDEMFDEIVNLAFKHGKKKKDDEEDDEEKEDASIDEAVSEEEIDDAEATADSLEEVEESDEDIALGDVAEDTSVASARASASEWLESNVLRSTANLE